MKKEKRLGKEELTTHIIDQISDYGKIIVIAALFKKIYGEFPKIGLSGQQAEYAQLLYSRLPLKNDLV